MLELLEADTAQGQLVGQRGLVDRFQKAWAENPVYFHGSADNGVRKLFEEDLGHKLPSPLLLV